jgi:DNA-binding MarR family transcriptional regulator
MPASTYDIKSDNFDVYWVKEMLKLTPSQKLSLPSSLLKHQRGWGSISLPVAKRLTFAQKAQLLVQYCNKKVFVFVDDENGMSVEKFIEYYQENIDWRKELTEKDIEIKSGAFDFVLGQKELIDGMDYLSIIFRSPLYNYMNKPKNKSGASGVGKYDVEVKHFSKLAEALYNYEVNKTFFLKAANLTPAMWYVLLYFGDGKQKKASSKIDGAMGCTARSIQDAVYFLNNSGYIRRIGDTKVYYEITPHGLELLYKILSKDVIDY